MDIDDLKRRAGIVENDYENYPQGGDGPRVSPDGGDSAKRKERVVKALMVYADSLDGKATTLNVARASTPQNAEKAQRFKEMAREYEELARTIDTWANL